MSSSDGEYDDDIDALIEADQQTAAVSSSSLQREDVSSSPHDALPSLEQVDGDDDGCGGGFIIDEPTQAAGQQKAQLSGNKRKHGELGQTDSDSNGAGAELDELDDVTADEIDRLIAEHEQQSTTPPLRQPAPPSQPQSSPSAASTSTNPAAILACGECHAFAYNVPYYKAFGLLVCNGCQSAHPGTYALCTKSTARTQYLLSDAELAALPHLLRPNPAKGSFANMKLLRTADVRSAVERRYGSEAAMEEEKRRRERERLEKDVSKRRKERAKVDREKRVREWRMDKEAEAKGHKHTYVDVAVRGGHGKKQQCSSCGFTLSFEEL